MRAGEAQTWIETNRADLVLSEKPERDERFYFVPLFADRFRIIVNPSHPWATGSCVPRGELPKQPHLRCRASPQTQRMIDDFLARDGIVLNTMVEMETIEAITEFLKTTLCFSILPTWMVDQELISRSLVALPLSRRTLDQTWGFLHRRDRPLNHAESTFVKLCRDGMQRFRRKCGGLSQSGSSRDAIPSANG